VGILWDGTSVVGTSIATQNLQEVNLHNEETGGTSLSSGFWVSWFASSTAF